MLAVVLLGLLACEGIASFKFERYYDKKTGILEGPPFDTSFMSSRKDKEYLIKRKEVMDKEITRINKLKESIDIRLEYLYSKERLDREIEKLQNEIEKLDPMDVYSSNDGQRTADNVYTLTMSLEGYKEEEITLNARKGLLEIDAFHVSLDRQLNVSYTLVKQLPDNVDPNGYWSYDGGVLRVNFPIQQNGTIISTKYISSLKNKVNTDSEMIYNKQTSTEKNFPFSHFKKQKTQKTENVRHPFNILDRLRLDEECKKGVLESC